jgi:hypothetical protein
MMIEGRKLDYAIIPIGERGADKLHGDNIPGRGNMVDGIIHHEQTLGRGNKSSCRKMFNMNAMCTRRIGHHSPRPIGHLPRKYLRQKSVEVLAGSMGMLMK